MEKFRYKAKTPEGVAIKGLIKANNRKGAVAILKSKGLIIVDLQEVKEGFGFSISMVLQRVSSNDIVNFTRQLSTMISAGLPLTDALASLQQQTKPAFAKVLTEVLNDIKGGSSLYKAFSKHSGLFPKVYLALIKSGEAAGVLDKVLLRLADNLEKQREFRGKAIGAFIYPVIIVLGMAAVLFVMMVFVIPQLTSMFEEYGVSLPIATRVLITLSRLLKKLWPLLIVLLIGGVVGFRLWLQTSFGRKQFDAFIISVPLIGRLLQKMILTEVTRTLSILVGSGVSIIKSLDIVAEAAGNVVFEKSLREAAVGVEKGVSLTAMIARFDFYPPIVPQMIDVGEKTGKLDEVLGRLSGYFEMETEIALKSLTTAIEPIMIIVLGLGVGFLVVSIIMPIYTLTSQF